MSARASSSSATDSSVPTTTAPCDNSRMPKPADQPRIQELAERHRRGGDAEGDGEIVAHAEQFAHHLRRRVERGQQQALGDAGRQHVAERAPRRQRLPDRVQDRQRLQRALVLRRQRLGQAQIHPGHGDDAIERQEDEDPAPGRGEHDDLAEASARSPGSPSAPSSRATSRSPSAGRCSSRAPPRW